MYRFKISAYSHAVLRYILVSIFFLITVSLFFYLNKVQPNYYIDEIFHIPQTLRFCDGNFYEWDQKITTFPGLYLISILVLAPLNLCTTSYLRSINLIGTFSNFYVIYEILRLKIDNKSVKKKNNKDNKNCEIKKWTRLITSLNIALLPPLYFLLFLYYTDVISTNIVLFMYLFYLKESFKTSAFLGILAVLLRQTNIVWVAWISLERGMDIVEKKNFSKIKNNSKNTSSQIFLLWETLKEEYRKGKLPILIIELIKGLFPFVFIGLSFVIFVLWNGGIVLGDRTAHVATIHIPQLFYCASFFGFFAWPYFLPYSMDYLRLVKNRWMLAISVFILMAITVRFNTLVHPYLLADNRHYTFYVWNKIIGRYALARYILIPIYAFFFYATYRSINHLRYLSKIFYFITVSLVSVPQLLLEPRYFFIPYIIFRINIGSVENWQLIAESVMTVIVNIFQFYIFSNKTFYWQDDVNPQRISW